MAGAPLGIMITAVAGVTSLGLLAPVVPMADAINHARPLLLFAALALAAVAWQVGTRLQRTAAGLAAAVNVALAAAPLLAVAPLSERSAQTFKVISFNVWIHNRNIAAIASFLRKEAADIVVLQELHAVVADVLMDKVRDLYPHAIHCTGLRACDGAILARRPWRDAHLMLRVAPRPPSVHARFEDDGAGGPLRVIGTHLARPDKPRLQAEQLHALIADIGAPGGPDDVPTVVAGDFNLTPWSWHLNVLSRQTGLMRPVTGGASWPAHRTTDEPMVLIDHVLVSRHFAVVSYRTGPRLGSDHLPVIVEFARRP
ncbi:MAG TPA: endonuclease/exonuclease/phosphatase family protein [Hyphomicrobiaceae bacterium]|nr:endonuclease/exonuclease/phosphatase family protein [Hyphomicrobiaceae bacterium]